MDPKCGGETGESRVNLTNDRVSGMDGPDMTSLPHASVDLGSVQTIRKAVLLVAVTALILAFIFVASTWPEGHLVHEMLEWAGIGLIAVCIIGRTWCSLYIGGRKNTELVAVGPYSVTRNPLYVFSILGAAGIGAQLGSIVLTVASCAIAWIVFLVVAMQEEKYLLSVHGDSYRDYLMRVPRFLPRLSQWHNVDVLHVQPSNVVRTFVDACFFLVAIPAAEFFESMQSAGLIPILFRVP